MGTRAYTLFDENECAAAIYRQYDGYLDGHGAFLRENFGNTAIINGMRGGEEKGTHANGLDCLAAQIVAKLKEQVGGVYLHSRPDDEEKRWTDFVYTIRSENTDRAATTRGRTMVEVRRFGRLVYDGPLSELPGDEYLDCEDV